MPELRQSKLLQVRETGAFEEPKCFFGVLKLLVRNFRPKLLYSVVSVASSVVSPIKDAR
jgi:hypothetical protein